MSGDLLPCFDILVTVRRKKEEKMYLLSALAINLLSRFLISDPLCVAAKTNNNVKTFLNFVRTCFIDSKLAEHTI